MKSILKTSLTRRTFLKGLASIAVASSVPVELSRVEKQLEKYADILDAPVNKLNPLFKMYVNDLYYGPVYDVMITQKYEYHGPILTWDLQEKKYINVAEFQMNDPSYEIELSIYDVNPMHTFMPAEYLLRLHDEKTGIEISGPSYTTNASVECSLYDNLGEVSLEIYMKKLEHNLWD